MLENFVFTQKVAEDVSPIFQQDGAPPLVPLYPLPWMNNFLVDGSAGKGQLIGPHGVLT